ncbi:hypothetical protein DUT91_23835 [Phyllobacterium salinisoli]|uniref:Uncharacterized protein n=2 Tax=Phyllobacterium salinisoli TaxID=1899321 RepID=A0A368JWC9_9HYPH|nr:hypothetical protein DUT91_23835 [Phyllobacterium salinisoli]
MVGSKEAPAIETQTGQQEEAQQKEIAEQRERERNQSGGGTSGKGGIQVCFPSAGQCSGRSVLLDLTRDGVIAPMPLPEATP